MTKVAVQTLVMKKELMVFDHKIITINFKSTDNVLFSVYNSN